MMGTRIAGVLELETQVTARPAARHRSQQNRKRLAEPLADDVAQLLALVKTSEPGNVQRFFFQVINRRLDAELTELASHFAGQWDPDIETDHIKALMSAGQPRRATNAIIAQMRREVVEELRAQRRAESDAFLDAACVVD